VLGIEGRIVTHATEAESGCAIPQPAGCCVAEPHIERLAIHVRTAGRDPRVVRCGLELVAGERQPEMTSKGAWLSNVHETQLVKQLATDRKHFNGWEIAQQVIDGGERSRVVGAIDIIGQRERLARAQVFE
jgi:hypothetical protein